MACSKCKSSCTPCTCRSNTIVCRPVCPEPVPCVNPCPCVETANVGVDTNTVDVTTSGALDRVIAANVKISTLPNNSIVAQTDGIYSEAVANVGATTPSAVVTTSGTLGSNIAADVKISAVPGNDITVNPDGLYSPAAAIVTPATLVNNGNRTFTFDNSVDVPTNFCQGVTSVDTPVGCEGIGSNNMVRSLSFTDCALNISSAPEHTTGMNSGAQTGLAYLPVPPGTTRILSQNILIQNPSTCRSFTYRLIQEAVIEMELLANAECIVTTINNPLREGGPGSSQIRRGITRVTQAFGTLAPGGSVVITVFIDVTLVAGTINIYGCGQTIGYVGGTV